jgi:NAD-dependent deacetylase
MSSAGSINQLVEALQSGGPTVVLTGAGVSLASGIPTFRGTDAGAVWASNVMARATLEHFRREPADSWSWYRERHARVLAAQPNSFAVKPRYVAAAASGLQRPRAAQRS